MATNLLKGQRSEWTLLKRHPSEDIFGAQTCGSHPDQLSRVAELLDNETDVDFVDVNMGCPINGVCSKGAGSALLLDQMRLRSIVRCMAPVLSCPLTIKIRTGYVLLLDLFIVFNFHFFLFFFYFFFY